MGETKPPVKIFRPDAGRAYGTLGLIAAAALWLYWLSVTMPDGDFSQALRLGIVAVTVVLALIVVQTTLNLVTRRLSVELTADALVYRDPEPHRLAKADIVGAELVRDEADPDAPRHILIRYRHDAVEGDMIREARLPFAYASDLVAMHGAIEKWLGPRPMMPAPARLPTLVPEPQTPLAPVETPSAPEGQTAVRPASPAPRPRTRIAARSVFGQKQ